MFHAVRIELPADAIAAAGPHHALVFVHGDYWTSYAALSWLNSPTLDGDVVFAKDRGAPPVQLVAAGLVSVVGGCASLLRRMP